MFKRLAKALIRLCVCAGWSEPLLVAHTTLLEISCHGSYNKCRHGIILDSLVAAFHWFLLIWNFRLNGKQCTCKALNCLHCLQKCIYTNYNYKVVISTNLSYQQGTSGNHVCQSTQEKETLRLNYSILWFNIKSLHQKMGLMRTIHNVSGSAINLTLSELHPWHWLLSKLNNSCRRPTMIAQAWFNKHRYLQTYMHLAVLRG